LSVDRWVVALNVGTENWSGPVGSCWSPKPSARATASAPELTTGTRTTHEGSRG
jgi:hypothetical protein